MFKKIILTLILVICVIATIILFAPLGMFSENVEILINENSNMKIEFIEPFSYNLANFDTITFNKTKIQTQKYEILLNKFDFNLDISALQDKRIIISKLIVDIEQLIELPGTSEVKKETKKTKNNNDPKNKIKEVVLSHLKIKINDISVKKYQLKKINIEAHDLHYKLDGKGAYGELSASFSDNDTSLDIKLNDKKELVVTLDVKNLERFLNLVFKKNFDLYGELKVIAKGNVPALSKPDLKNVHIYAESHRLQWKNKNIDEILNHYLDSRNFGLMDAAGFLTLGPIGIIASKSSNLSKLGMEASAKGVTEVSHLIADLNYQEKKILINDLGILTRNHRVFFRGGVDLDNKKFQDFQISGIDNNGCELFSQKLSGALSDPEIGAVITLFGEALSSFNNLLQKGKNTLGQNCEPIYDGNLEKLQ